MLARPLHLYALALLACSSMGLAPKTAAAQEESSETTTPREERAQETQPSAEKPWARGVSPTDQAEALSRFRTGNTSFVERDFKTALNHYLSALEHWKHPAIHFNVAVCQVNLDQPLAAYENIQAAVAYGDAPLGEEGFTQASTYRKLLEGRIGRVVVSSPQERISVSIDGATLLEGPGRKEQVLLPGEHELVAKADGYVTSVRRVQVLPGETTSVDLHLVKVGEQAYERPMPSWIPWAVGGAGVAVVGAGIALRVVARGQLDRYEENFGEECPEGCLEDGIPEDLRADRSQARTTDVAAIVGLSVGGAALVTGVSLIIYNQPRPVDMDDDGIQVGALELSPQLGPNGGGLAIGGSF